MFSNEIKLGVVDALFGQVLNQVLVASWVLENPEHCPHSYLSGFRILFLWPQTKRRNHSNLSKEYLENFLV